MNIDSPHLPPQAHALLDGRKQVETYEATGGAVTSQFAEHNLSLIPPIPVGSVIHDNTSGNGQVTRLILQDGRKDVKIHATDIDQVFLDDLSSQISQHGWDNVVEASNQKSEAWAKAEGDEGLRRWAEMSWAYLGGIGRWQEGDKGKWDDAVNEVVKLLKGQVGKEDANGNVNVKLVDGVYHMRASQWVVIATK